MSEFTERLRCVPRILTAQNAKLGRPLDEHDLSDLVQDTVLIILNKLKKFAGNAPLEAWIYRVCCLEFMNGLRRKRRHAKPDTDVLDMQVDEATQRERSGLEERERVYGALDLVGGVEAETVRLKHFEGLTFEEMGERLSISPNTLKTRYYRGMDRLQQILSRDMSGDGGEE